LDDDEVQLYTERVSRVDEKRITRVYTGAGAAVSQSTAWGYSSAYLDVGNQQFPVDYPYVHRDQFDTLGPYPCTAQVITHTDGIARLCRHGQPDTRAVRPERSIRYVVFLTRR
jgi:hypothetical protein